MGRLAECDARTGDSTRRRYAGRGIGPRRSFNVEIRTYFIEDNATIRENLVATLEELASVRPVGWADGEDDAKLWLTANAASWDLAIVDLFLRQGSGLGVIGACRKRGADQRVIVLSNYATADMRQRCAELGADAVFDKSREIDDLIDYCITRAGEREFSR
jgi:two-component system OmpR family response regulator